MKKKILLSVALVLIFYLFLAYLPACMCEKMDEREYEIDAFVRAHNLSESLGPHYFKYFDDLKTEEIKTLWKEMDRIEEETGQKDKTWTKEEVDLLKGQLFGDKDKEQTEETEVADNADEQTTVETSAETTAESKKDTLTGVWAGEMKRTELTGTYTTEVDGKEKIYDVNEMWGWWLEEPPNPISFEIVSKNGGYTLASMDNSSDSGLSVVITFEDGIFQMDIGGIVFFTGALEEENLLKGTYEEKNILADEGAITYGEWWLERQ